MNMSDLEAYYLPPGVQYSPSGFNTVFSGDLKARYPDIDPSSLKSLADDLKKASKALKKKPIEEIIAVLDRASEKWLNPEYELRRKALESISGWTGYSEEIAALSIDLEMKSSRSFHFRRALSREFGDPACLDGFVQNSQLGGKSMAVGPNLTGGIMSANIPALPHLTVMRSLLVKSSCLVRVSAGEPTFLPMYARTLAEIDGLIGDCLAVLYWERERDDIECAFLESIDAVVVYGGPEAVAHYEERAPRNIPTLFHRHKMGVGMVGREMLDSGAVEELSRAIAWDTAVFDQEACLAPHVYYVEEGGEISPEKLAELVVRRLDEFAAQYPPRTITPSDKAMLRQHLDGLAMSGEIKVMGDNRLNSLVIFGKMDTFTPSPLNRILRIAPVDELNNVLPELQKVSKYLQNVAVAASEERKEKLAVELALMGASRITVPGNMPTPSMMWQHDGMPCLSRLSRWCDREETQPG